MVYCIEYGDLPSLFFQNENEESKTIIVENEEDYAKYIDKLKLLEKLEKEKDLFLKEKKEETIEQLEQMIEKEKKQIEDEKEKKDKQRRKVKMELLNSNNPLDHIEIMEFDIDGDAELKTGTGIFDHNLIKLEMNAECVCEKERCFTFNQLKNNVINKFSHDDQKIMLSLLNRCMHSFYFSSISNTKW